MTPEQQLVMVYHASLTAAIAAGNLMLLGEAATNSTDISFRNRCLATIDTTEQILDHLQAAIEQLGELDIVKEEEDGQDQEGGPTGTVEDSNP